MDKTEIWQQASQLYEQFMDVETSVALKQLQHMDDVPHTIKQAVQDMLLSNTSSTEAIAGVVNEARLIDSDLSDQQLDQYRLLKKIGEGGMATVYLAERMDAEVQKKVAIKIFDRHRLSEKMVQHFEMEQAILSQLNHPNIISMHHSGLYEQLPYMVMDYAQGAASLDDYASTKQLDDQQKVSLIQQAAEALAYAHGHLVVHRDLKPSNILVDESEHLRVVDFGIARHVNVQDKDDKATTLYALTPSFAAPEQMLENAVSVRSDVFSLTAVLLNLLTGEAPLPKDRLIKGCQLDDEYIQQQLKQLSVDRDLKNIINRGLQSDPSRRYSTIQALADDLTHWLNNEPVSATPDSISYRLRKLVKRRPALMASGVTLLLSLAVGISALLWQVQKTQLEAEKANQVKQFMLSTYSVTNPEISQGEMLTASDLLASSLAELNVNDTLDQSLKAELLQSIGVAYGQLGNHQQAVEVLQSANGLDESIETTRYIADYLLGDKQVVEAEKVVDGILARSDLGESLQPYVLLTKSRIDAYNSRYDTSEKMLAQALQGFERNADRQGILETRLAQAHLLNESSKGQEAVAYLEDFLQEFEPEYGTTHPRIMEAKYLLSSSANAVGDFSKSIAYLEPMINGLKEVLGDEHPEYIFSLLTLGDAYQSLGEMQQAQQLAQEAHQKALKKFGPDHTSTGLTLGFLATLSVANRQYTEAIAQLEDAARISQLHFGEKNRNYLSLLAQVVALKGSISPNEETLKQAQELYQLQIEVNGVDHYDTIFTQYSLATVRSAMGEHDAAIAMASDGLTRARNVFGDQHPATGNFMFGLGKFHLVAERFEEAAAAFEEILAANVLGENDPNRTALYQLMSSAYESMGQMEKADEYTQLLVQKANEIFGEASMGGLQNQLVRVQFLHRSGRSEEAGQLAAQMRTTMQQLGAQSQPLEAALNALNL